MILRKKNRATMVVDDFFFVFKFMTLGLSFPMCT